MRFKIAVPLMIVFLLGGLAYLLLPKPELVVYQSYSTAVYDKHGALLRLSLSQDQRYRLYTPFDEIPEHIIDATILYEDKNYYQHSGVDYLALLRAFWQTYVKQERKIGASTLVMQVARLRWNIPSSSIQGKLQQIFRAIQLSRHYSKNELIESYLNLAPYGGNVEGIGAASLVYFGKPASQLSIPEALTLAVVPQNPNKRNPSKPDGLINLQTARENLYQKWLDTYPSDKALGSMMKLALQVASPKDLPFHAPHFVDTVLLTQGQFSSGKLSTTLDYKLQNSLTAVLEDYITQNKQRGFNNASALLLNTNTMQIEAMIGSASFNNKVIYGQVNGTLAKRSPGSTLKPFVYGLAMDAGIIHPMTMLADLPKRYAGFTPENFGSGFLGPVSAQDALIKSRNLPVVELQQQLSELRSSDDSRLTNKPIDLYNLLERAQVRDMRGRDFYGLALALGGIELSMLELVELYAMLANKGEYQKASFLQTNQSESSGMSMLSPEAAFLTLDMLSKNPKPSAYRSAGAQSNNEKAIAWKTGTSWAFRDAWAIGIKGNYVLAVWIGNFNGAGNNAFIGRSAAGPLLFRMFGLINGNATNNTPSNNELANLNLQKVAICKPTGDLFEAACPEKASSWFIPGVSPIKQSNIYRTLLVNAKTGLRSCRPNDEDVIQKAYAFWPSDFLELFEKANIYIEKAPKYEASCHAQASTFVSAAPEIISPQNTLNYIVQENQSATVPIELKARVDAEVSHLYWFANGRLIASRELGSDLSSGMQDVLLWQAEVGKYEIQVSDDLGKSAAVDIVVIAR